MVPPRPATIPPTVAAPVVEDVRHELVQIVAAIRGRIDDPQVTSVMCNLPTSRSAGDARSRADINDQVVTMEIHDKMLDATGTVSIAPVLSISTAAALPSVVTSQIRVHCWDLALLDKVDLPGETLPASNRRPRVRECPEWCHP